MYAGQKVEEADVETLFARPRHPYTRGLMASIPALPTSGDTGRGAARGNPGHGAGAHAPAAGLRLRAALPARDPALPRGVPAAAGLRRRSLRGVLARGRDGGRGMSEAAALLEVTDLVKHYPVRRGVLRRRAGTVQAVDGVSFALGAARRSGWSANPAAARRRVARSVLRLVEPTSGQIRFEGDDITPSRQDRDATAPARDADRVPGPVRLAQSAHACRRHRRRAA